MAVAGAVKLEVIARAQENVRAVLKQSNAAIKQSASELKKAGVAQTKMGAAVGRAIGQQSKYRAALVRTADRISNLGSKMATAKAAIGAFAAAFALRAIKDFIIEGEKAANVALRFAQAIPNASVALGDLKKASAGLVTETELQVIANRFKRLGVPIKQTTRLLELATKASVDQGRTVVDVARVIESSLKGRTTGLVDIGVNIDKITGITKEYAKATGRAVGEIDEMERRMKVALPAALQTLGEQFDAVDLDKFQLDMQRANTQFDDFISDLQTASSTKFMHFVDLFRGGPNDIPDLVDDLNSLQRQMERSKILWGSLASAKETLEYKTALVDQAKATKNLGAAIGALNPAEKIAAFQSLRATYEESTDAVREQIRALFDLEQAWADVKAEREARSPPPSGLFVLPVDPGSDTGGASPADIEAFTKAEAIRAKAAEAAAKAAARATAAARSRDAATRARGQAMLERILARHAAQKKKYLDQIDNQKDVNALEMLGTKAAKGLLKIEYQIRDIKKESNTILDEAVAKEWEKVKIQGVRIKQQADETKAEREKAIAEQQGIDSATHALALAHDMFDVDRIALELAREIALIEAEAISDEEKRLLIELARVDAARELGEIERENRSIAAEEVAEAVGPALGEAAGIFAKMDADLEALGRPKRYETISKGFAALAAQSHEIAKASAQFANAVGKGDQEIAKGVAASLGAIQPAVAAFVEGTRDRALVMMAFELAMAVAEGVAGNYPAAVGHGIAAGMFGVVAGMSASQPTTAAAPQEKAGAGGLITPAGDAPEEREASSFTINLGPGTIFGLPQEMGAQIAERINSMAGSGFEESTSF
jgi:hypothetical protein